MKIKNKELKNEICVFLKDVIENIADGYGSNTYVKLKLSDVVGFLENPKGVTFEKKYHNSNLIQNVNLRNRIIKIYAWHYKFNDSISSELKEWLDINIKMMYKVNGKKINYLKQFND
jgi:hypothetical protein